MTGPQDLAAAGDGWLKAGHADRERVIEALKDAFVQGRLTREELGARAGRALSARTYAELATLIADIPAGAGLARPAAPARRWPLAKAAAGSGGCLVISFAAVLVGASFDNPVGPSPYKSWTTLCLVVALAAFITAIAILGNGVATSIEQRRSRKQRPSRPGPGGRALEAGRRGGAGHGPVPPGSRTDQTRADLRAHKSRQRHVPARAGRAPRGVRPAPGAA